ncbi:MAG TPA: tRNA pseudouridine(38-40) synthase TruA [Clostridiales bacterium UBA8960]|nr:tRNA pseudouridine(38-40) synthase TruA [Clostridiales bacterium UBA8960]
MTYKMSISYEGSRYKGWQRLKTSRDTIQEKIEFVLSRIFECSIEIHGSGRTDAGVHAYNQIASFKAERVIECEWLKKEMNRYLPEDIVILSVENVHESFHARFNAKKKVYTYQVWTKETPPVFERHFVYDIQSKPLDQDLMKRASKRLVGTHDFKGFSTDKTKKSTIRTIESIEFLEEDRVLKIIVTGNGFLYNMVRIIVGTLLEVGYGIREAETITEVLNSGVRSQAGETAPAKGLFLTEVIY